MSDKLVRIEENNEKSCVTRSYSYNDKLLLSTKNNGNELHVVVHTRVLGSSGMREGDS